MKRRVLLAINIIFLCILFTSCQNSSDYNEGTTFGANGNSVISSSSWVSEEEKNQVEPVTVKPHKIVKWLDGGDTYNFNKKAEEVFNLINSGNSTGLEKMFSQTTKSEVPALKEQIDKLMNYFDNPIVDYEEGVPGGGSHIDGGEVLEKDFFGEIIFYTESTEYRLWLDFTLKDSENNENVGLECIFITTKEAWESSIERSNADSSYKAPWDGFIHIGVLLF